MKYFLPLFFGVLLLPLVACADVKINEVAWMGTAKSPYSEWIELYNSGENAVSLAGWKLYTTSNEVLFALTKTIAAKGYLLVERATASAPDAVAGINDETGTFGAGGLNNAGENLTLKDSSGATMDSLPFAGGWPAGDADTKDTMQWNGQKWITAPATPDAANATVSVAPPATTSGSGTSTPASGSGSSAAPVKNVPTTKTVNTKSKLTLTPPATVFQGVRNEYDASVDIADTLKTPQGYFYWNMGDGNTFVQPTLAPVGYSYHYAGTYTITLAYFSSPYASQPFLQTTAVAAVTQPLATLQTLANGAALQITNDTTKAMDIGQWPITTTLGVRSMPPLTIIPAKAHITVTAPSLGLPVIQNPTLSTPDGTAVGEPAKKTAKK